MGVLILIIVFLAIALWSCIASGSRPPENLNRKQIYEKYLAEKHISDIQLDTIKKRDQEIYDLKKQAEKLNKEKYSYGQILAKEIISEKNKKCAEKIAEVQLECQHKTEQFQQLAEKYADENTKFQNLLKERAKSEKWFANYIFQLKIADDQHALEKKHGYETIKSLEKRFKEKYKPAVYENIVLNARIFQYESLFPSLVEHIEKAEQLESDIPDDGGRSWLSDAEFKALPDSQKNQLILDRYHAGGKKSKWQIGRDYELYIGHMLAQNGFTNIIQYGIEKKLEDLGIDIIATNPKNGKIYFIQCKRWSAERLIRENTVTQLYAGALIHCLHNNQNFKLASLHIYTTAKASELANECAKTLGVHISEDKQPGEYPSIKCKAGTDEFGLHTYIYHLPIDQMYDRTQIKDVGDCYAFTIEEAERQGFRRAFRWHGNTN